MTATRRGPGFMLALPSTQWHSRASWASGMRWLHTSEVQERQMACADLTDQPIARRYSMLRMGLAPCSPFTVTQDLMVEAAKLARKYEGVRLHTHMAENQACFAPQPPMSLMI